MIVTCPHCKIALDTDQAAYIEDDLILCEHCGNDFLAPPDPRRDPRIAPAVREEPRPPSPPPPPPSSPPPPPPSPPAAPFPTWPPPPPPPPAPAAPPPEPEPEPPSPPRIVISPDDLPGHPAAGPAAEAPPAGPATTFAWTLGILALLVLLAGQYAYFMRDELAPYPPLRPWIERLCAYAGCRVPLVHAPDRIRVMARDIRRHPTAADGLLVSVTFSNQAAYRQAYPAMQLSFFDMRDQVVARRGFRPAEYLPRGIDADAGMAAGSAVQVTLEIVDPGPNAVNFTLEFH